MHMTLPTAPPCGVTAERILHDLACRDWTELCQLRQEVLDAALAGAPAAPAVLRLVVEAIDRRPEGQRLAEKRAQAVAEGEAQMRRRRTGRVWKLLDPTTTNSSRPFEKILDRPLVEAHQIFTILARDSATHRHLIMKAG